MKLRTIKKRRARYYADHRKAMRRVMDRAEGLTAELMLNTWAGEWAHVEMPSSYEIVAEHPGFIFKECIA
jgi:hypothetical protein